MFSTIRPAEKVNFAKNLSVMMKSGITLDDALIELAEQARSKAFRTVILGVRGDIGKGMPLSQSFAKYPAFDSVSRALVRAGEASGSLEENLVFLADWLEQEQDMKKEIASATLYPKIVIVAVVILAVGLNLFVLPKLLPLFADMNVELPWATRALFAAVGFFRSYWYAALGIMAVAAAGGLFLRRLASVRNFLDGIYLRLPFFGTLLVDYEMAVMSQLFFTCFKSGLPMQDALGIVSEVASSSRYKAAFVAIADRIRTGTALSEGMKAYRGLFPRQVISIVATGEKSGTISDSFRYLSEFYSKEVRSKTKDIPTVIEPVLLLFIAGVIGFIAFSVIVPIYKLSTNVS